MLHRDRECRAEAGCIAHVLAGQRRQRDSWRLARAGLVRTHGLRTQLDAGDDHRTRQRNAFALEARSCSGTGFISYSFTVITRYVNNGSTPASLLTCDSRHPYFNVWGVGNNVGNSPYDPLSTCDVPLPTLTVAPGAVRFDTLSIVGPTTTGADGVASTPLYGQVLLSFRGGTGCSWALSQLCVRQPSTVFAIRLPQ